MGFDTILNFTACRDCDELYPVPDIGGAIVDDADAVDPYRQFLVRHQTHHIAALRRRGFECHADRPLWDPLATLRFEVTDGDRSYVVCATRASIEDERVYRFAPGVLDKGGGSEVEIDPHNLRRGLSHPYALRPMQIDRFFSALDEVISQIDPDELVTALDDADDPAVSVADMPDPIYNELLARCTCGGPSAPQRLSRARELSGILQDTLRDGASSEAASRSMLADGQLEISAAADAAEELRARIEQPHLPAVLLLQGGVRAFD
jgi:hypothetical protein